MTFTPLTALEFGFGLILVVAVVVVGLNYTGSGELTDLLLGALSLVGIVIMAHAIWLMRKREL
jgi:uncharacterized membrane protein